MTKATREKRKKLAKVWAAVDKKTGEVWFINDRKSELKDDLGDHKGYRIALLVESRN